MHVCIVGDFFTVLQLSRHTHTALATQLVKIESCILYPELTRMLSTMDWLSYASTLGYSLAETDTTGDEQ
jgi:hypothetical protein